MEYSLELDILVQLSHQNEIDFVRTLTGRVPNMFLPQTYPVFENIMRINYAGDRQSMIVLIAGLSDVPAIKEFSNL